MDEHYEDIGPESHIEPPPLDDPTVDVDVWEEIGERYDAPADIDVTTRDDAPAEDVDVTQLPSEVRFGAQLGPYGETADSYAEKYNYSTTTDTYIGEKSGREIDPYTDTEKKA